MQCPPTTAGLEIQHVRRRRFPRGHPDRCASGARRARRPVSLASHVGSGRLARAAVGSVQPVRAGEHAGDCGVVCAGGDDGREEVRDCGMKQVCTQCHLCAGGLTGLP